MSLSKEKSSSEQSLEELKSAYLKWKKVVDFPKYKRDKGWSEEVKQKYDAVRICVDSYMSIANLKELADRDIPKLFN